MCDLFYIFLHENIKTNSHSYSVAPDYILIVKIPASDNRSKTVTLL